MKRNSGEAIRANVLERNAKLKNLPSHAKPTPDSLLAYQEMAVDIKKVTHELGRGKQDIAIQLGMTVKELEALLVGKSVLDIGCGIGRFSSEAASLKRTKVTALDLDPEVLARVPKHKNITVVEGSGFTIQEVLGDDEFDVVVSSFLSLLWARTPVDKMRAIDSALLATAPKGTAIFIPIFQNVAYREQSRFTLETLSFIEGHGMVDDETKQTLLSGLYVADFLEVITVDRLMEIENEGVGTVTFTANLATPIRGVPQEAYSAIVQQSI